MNHKTPANIALADALETIARLARSNGGVFEHIVENDGSAPLRHAFRVAATELPFLQSQFNAVTRGTSSSPKMRLSGAAMDERICAIIDVPGVSVELREAIEALVHNIDDHYVEDIVDEGRARIEATQNALALARELIDEAQSELARAIEEEKHSLRERLTDLDSFDELTEETVVVAE